MKNIQENIKRYVNAWNETTPEAIKTAFEQCCAPDLTYTDKVTQKLTGIDELTALAMISHERFPGRTFFVMTEPEYFEGQAYYTWGIHLPGVGDRAGHDFMEYNEDEAITRVVGFLPVV
jgi:hypothetical protein